jgi:hypothetical protein
LLQRVPKRINVFASFFKKKRLLTALAKRKRPSVPPPTKLPCGDEALQRQTRRDWSEWAALLDAEGAASMTHQQIVAIVQDTYDAGSWWSQMITVGYERLRGLRAVGQGRGGSFAVSASRTLPISAARAHQMFTDRGVRDAWLGDHAMLRTAVPPKSLRLTWPDDTVVAVVITAKGADKCSVAIEHGKLVDASAAADIKAFWVAALERLSAAAQ